MERLNELQVFRADGDRARGFKTVLVSEADHPFWEHWWPPGHIIGWGDTFVHELHHVLQAIADDGDIAPYGATFEDGYRAAEVCDAIVRSSGSGQREQLSYKTPSTSEARLRVRAAPGCRDGARSRLRSTRRVPACSSGPGRRAVSSPLKPSPLSVIVTKRSPNGRWPIVTSACVAFACLRTFARPSWTMRKISICSSGARRIVGVDLQLDLEHAVRGEELDIAAKGRVERRGAARRRESEDREARLLLREDRRLLRSAARTPRQAHPPRASTHVSRRRRGTAPGRRGSRVPPVRARRRPRARTRRTGSRATRRSGRRRTRACAGSRPATRACSRAAAGRRDAAPRRA